MKSSGHRCSVVLCLLIVGLWTLGLPSSTGAEVLVLSDGSELEIQGDFTIDGRKVTFTDSRGRLAMLRLSDVDLDATAQANTPPAEDTGESTSDPAVDAPTEAPVLVLTNADVSTVDAEDVEATEYGPKVIVYSTSWCPACHKTKRLLADWQVEYDERDVEKDPLARDEKRNKDPQCGVPVIDVGGQFMCGLNPARLAEMLLAVGIEPVLDE